MSFRHPRTERLDRAGAVRSALVAVALPVALRAIGALASACSGEEAVPIDPANPPTTLDLTDVTHQLEPTDQMRDLAEQQCLDDPELDEGFVQAVDPTTDQVMSEVTVDCADVRSRG